MPSLITYLGGIGIGLVWGWLLVLIGGRAQAKHPVINGLSFTLTLVLLSATVLIFAHWYVVVAVLASTTVGASVHLAWLEKLRGDAT